MPNNSLSVLYKHIIQVENKNMGERDGRQTNKQRKLPFLLVTYLFVSVALIYDVSWTCK